jgi:hypothetical protein
MINLFWGSCSVTIQLIGLLPFNPLNSTSK